MITKRQLFVAVSIVMTGVSCSTSVVGQQFRGSEAPGRLAFKRLLTEPQLANWTQPVQFIVADGGQVSYFDGAGYQPVDLNARLGMRVGPVYRLKLESVFRGVPKTVYSTVEMLDRLYAPSNLVTKYPVKIVLTPEEIDQAHSGSMVTKVIYLEDPLTALPFNQPFDHLETVDLGQSQDPFIVADRMGRPMAIVRIGSRIPDPGEVDNSEAPLVMATGYEGEIVGTGVIDTNSPCNCEVCQAGDGCCCMERLNQLPPARRDEYICDGNDREANVVPAVDWSVEGLDIEDTIAHFDTLDGQIRVTPSNRVCIYSPRFAAVRRELRPNYETISQKLSVVDRKTNVKLAKSTEPVSTSHQNLQLQSNKLTQRPNQFLDRTRGVATANVTKLHGTRHNFKPFEDLQLIRFGEHSSSQDARLSLAMQSAITWNSDVEAQISINSTQPIIVNDISSPSEIVGIDSKGDANLRLCKLASAASAKSGDTVDFTIRFDNIGRQLIGNVTILDNLSPRLEFIKGTAECSVEAKFSTEMNKAGSLTLRWEIEDAVDKKEGGIIRFQCRVR